jgi:hypothetical protein
MEDRFRRITLLVLRVRDGWEDVWRSLVQLVLCTYMVWDARRLRLCASYFEGKQPQVSSTRVMTNVCACPVTRHNRSSSIASIFSHLAVAQPDAAAENF